MWLDYLHSNKKRGFWRNWPYLIYKINVPFIAMSTISAYYLYKVRKTLQMHCTSPFPQICIHIRSNLRHLELLFLTKHACQR